MFGRRNGTARLAAGNATSIRNASKPAVKVRGLSHCSAARTFSAYCFGTEIGRYGAPTESDRIRQAYAIGNGATEPLQAEPTRFVKVQRGWFGGKGDCQNLACYFLKKKNSVRV